uniref:DUF4012 domain-containing protein n=1 Tax=Olsenella timonensis TaxID=1805478 RepID=UPI00094E2B9E|nr:DUF4012 domain-containing protein [Olsenella timonensis]
MASHFAPQDDKPKKKAAPARAAAGRSRSDAAYYAASRRGGGMSRGKKVGLVIGIVLAVLLVVGGTCGVLMYRSAMSVKAQAQEIMDQVDPLKEALKSGDATALDSSVGTVQENMASINAEVHGPLWTLASFLPVVGEDVQSVRSLGEAGQALVDGVLVPIANDVSGTGVSGLFKDGVVNVGLVQTISETVSSSLPTIESSLDTIASLPEAHIPQLAEVLDRVRGPAEQAQGLVGQAKPFLDLLPQMLGADGQTRTYIVIAQNNSELRSTGGLPGAWGTVSVTDGAISMGEFQSILHADGLQVEATAEERAATMTNVDTDPAQVNCIPDFSRVGKLAKDYWAQAGYGDVDGVIAVDPVFLQRLLALTGGVTAPDGTVVDGSNAAQEILSGTYWKYGDDPNAQDAYFASVAGLAFGQIMGNLGNADITDLIDVIGQSGADGRLLAWMANEEEQALMEAIGVSGALETDPSEPVLGVYLNDDTYSKISWYASCYTTVGEGVKNADGTTTYDVTTTLLNTITPEEAATAPKYIYGGNEEKRDNSDMLNYVYFVAPAGGTITNLTETNGAVFDGYGFAETTLNGLQFFRTRTHLRSGESAVFTYQVTVSSEATEPLSVRTTPLAQDSLMQAPAE